CTLTCSRCSRLAFCICSLRPLPPLVHPTPTLFPYTTLFRSPSTLGEFASRITGSSDLYANNDRRPTASINFVTAHDGFTLNDLRSEEHTSELQSRYELVCRLLLETKQG